MALWETLRRVWYVLSGEQYAENQIVSALEDYDAYVADQRALLGDTFGVIAIGAITENQIQRDGRRYVTYQYTFHNGDMVHFYSMSKPGDYDVIAGLDEYREQAIQRVIEQDDGKLIAQIESGSLLPENAVPAHPDTMKIADRKHRLALKLEELKKDMDDDIVSKQTVSDKFQAFINDNKIVEVK